MQLTLAFYYLVKEKMIIRERKEKNIIEIKEKEQNRNLLCKYNSTYTNQY